MRKQVNQRRQQSGSESNDDTVPSKKIREVAVVRKGPLVDRAASDAMRLTLGAEA